MAVLDRSWYGRVLVERVEGFAEREEWLRAYDEIFNFEKGLADEGMILVKFWMHVSPEEQLKRFKARKKDPLKSWKLTDEDWRNREKRGDYELAVEDMIARTDQEPFARWHVIAGDSKKFARIQVLETVCAEIEDGHAPPRHRAAGARRRGGLGPRRRFARWRMPAATMSPAPAERDEDPVAHLVGALDRDQVDVEVQLRPVDHPVAEDQRDPDPGRDEQGPLAQRAAAGRSRRRPASPGGRWPRRSGGSPPRPR